MLMNGLGKYLGNADELRKIATKLPQDDGRLASKINSESSTTLDGFVNSLFDDPETQETTSFSSELSKLGSSVPGFGEVGNFFSGVVQPDSEEEPNPYEFPYTEHRFRVQIQLAFPDESTVIEGDPEGATLENPVDVSLYLIRFSETSNYSNGSKFPKYELILEVPGYLNRRIKASQSKSYEKRMRIMASLFRSLKVNEEGVVDVDSEEAQSSQAIQEETIYKSFELVSYDNSADIADDVFDQDSESPLYRLKFSCYSINDMRGSKSCRSRVFYNATVTDACIAILQDFYPDDRSFLVTTPAQNKTVYEQIVLPPCTIYEAIELIQEMYGIWETGAILYTDRVNTYLLPKNSLKMNNPTSDLSYKSIYLHVGDTKKTKDIGVFLQPPDEDSPQGDAGAFAGKIVGTSFAGPIGGFIGERVGRKVATASLPSKLHFMFPQNTFVILPKDDTTRELTGESLKLLTNTLESRDSKVNGFLTIKSANTLDDNPLKQNHPELKKERVYKNRYSNPYSLSVFQSESATKAVKIMFAVNAIDLETIRPNHVLNLDFEHEKLNSLYSGRYTVSSRVLSYVAVGDPAVCESYNSITLHKVSDQLEASTSQSKLPTGLLDKIPI